MTITIQTLGEFTLYRNGESVGLPKSKRTRALLAYLAVTNKPHRRERLCDLLWEMPDDPRGSLRWSLSKIRPLVNEPSMERLVANRDNVGLEKSDVVVDINTLEKKINNNNLSLVQLETFAEQLGEPFLDGIDLHDQDSFQQWLMAERNKTRKLRNSVLAQLSNHSALTPQEQLDWCKTWIRQDPFSTYAADALLYRLKLLGFSSEFKETLQNLQIRFRNACISWSYKTVSLDSALLSPSQKQPSLPEHHPIQTIKFSKTKDGVNIAHAVVGSGYPIVKAANWLSHLKHDWDAPIWSPMFRDLASDHLFLRYDERGNGLSDWELENLSFKAFVEDLETVISAHRLQKFALLGISQGASVSIDYAVKHPEKVSHLILFGGYASGWRVNASDDLTKEREAIMTLTATGWGQNNPAYRQIFSSTFMPSANKEELDWFNEFQRLTTSAENAVRFLSAFGDIDVREQLAKVSVPTLVIHSLGDQRIPIKVARDLAASIPNAEFLGLESDGHLLLGREPASKIFVDAVRSFVARR